MKWLTKMGARLFIAFGGFLLFFTVTFLILNILLISILYGFLNLNAMDYHQWLMALLSIWAILFFIAFAFFISMPIIHIIQWLAYLAGGRYEEPPFLFSKTKWFSLSIKLYKELFEHMQKLTHILMQSKKTQQQLKEKRNEWIAGIKHDLKTPLSYIKGYASMIYASNKWQRHEIESFAKKIETKTDEIEQLFNDLDLTEKLEKETFPFDLQPYPIVRLVKETVIDIANTPRFASYSFAFQSESSSIIAVVYPPLLRRALQNILINAAIHNPEETKIHTTIRQRNGQIEISVTDDGCGMDEDMLLNLFQKNYRGTLRGTGWGMALTKQWIEAQDGTVQASSYLGKGTTITLYLPTKK